MLACRNSNTWSTTNTIRVLLKNGANPNIQNNEGVTALMMAAKYSDTDSTLDTVKNLLEFRADPNIQDNYGNTTLIIISMFDSYNNKVKENTIKLLIDYGSKIDIVNNRNKTVFDFVSDPLKTKIIEWRSSYVESRRKFTEDIINQLNEIVYHPNSVNIRMTGYRFLLNTGCDVNDVYEKMKINDSFDKTT